MYSLQVIISLLFLGSGTLYAQQELEPIPKSLYPGVSLYESYCFYNGACTNYLLMGIPSIHPNKVDEYLKNGNFVKYEIKSKSTIKAYSRIEVERVNPKTATKEEILDQLLLAFSIYNICCFSKEGCSIYCNFKLEYFFENLDFEEKYRIEFPNNDFIEVIGLKNMERFDLKRKIIEEKKEPGFMEISFEEHEGVQIKCSENYYEETLFPGHLNFISKNPRFTRKQLRVEKVDMQKDEFDYE